MLNEQRGRLGEEEPKGSSVEELGRESRREIVNQCSCLNHAVNEAGNGEYRKDFEDDSKCTVLRNSKNLNPRVDCAVKDASKYKVPSGSPEGAD